MTYKILKCKLNFINMKKIYSLLLTVIITTLSLFAQAPQKMSYQAVIRDSENQLVVNTEIGMQISILQGSVFGASVYIETLTPETNANGLVTIEIGSEDATVVTGDFSQIDWTDGPYFIKTETDPSGGTAYTITGTSQLLSVPYALHSGSSDVLIGEITESQITDLQNYATKNMNNENITNLADPTDAQDAATKAYVDESAPATYEIGVEAHGGIVFYVEPCGTKGLVAAKTDQSDGVRWYAGDSGNTQAKGDGPYAGKANTSIIIAAHVAIGDDNNTYAARICNELQITEVGKTYGDWYLPSKEELLLMYDNLHPQGLGGFTNTWYWSSSEATAHNARLVSFTNGNSTTAGKMHTYYVRAVRAF